MTDEQLKRMEELQDELKDSLRSAVQAVKALDQSKAEEYYKLLKQTHEVLKQSKNKGTGLTAQEYIKEVMESEKHVVLFRNLLNLRSLL